MFEHTDEQAVESGPIEKLDRASHYSDLADLQLAVVGGGIGTVTFA